MILRVQMQSLISSDSSGRRGQGPQDTCAVAAEPCCSKDVVQSPSPSTCVSTSCTTEHAHLRVEPSPLPSPGQAAFPESRGSDAHLAAPLTQRDRPGTARNCRTAEARESAARHLLLQQRLEEHNRRVTEFNNEALSSARANAACLSHRGHAPSRPLKLAVDGAAAGCNDPALPRSPPVCCPTSRQHIGTVLEETLPAAPSSPAAESQVSELNASSGTTVEIPEHVQYV